MRDSIEWDAPHHDGNATYGDVGSDNPKAVWHELGTKHIPPRSFLGQAAMGKEHEITEMMAKEATKAMVLGGPNYRGMREVMHVLDKRARGRGFGRAGIRLAPLGGSGPKAAPSLRGDAARRGEERRAAERRVARELI